jgi:hypothetical protein
LKKGWRRRRRMIVRPIIAKPKAPGIFKKEKPLYKKTKRLRIGITKKVLKKLFSIIRI